MFGGGSSPTNTPGSKGDADPKSDTKSTSSDEEGPGPSNSSTNPATIKSTEQAAGEKRTAATGSGNGGGGGSPPGRSDNAGAATDKKRRSSGVSSKASSLLASAKNTLNFSQVGRGNSDLSAQTPIQKLGKQDPALAVPQGQHNNSAGESVPGPKSTFQVGVWEDRNRKCRRTMEDTHAFLYNFLPTPAPAVDASTKSKSDTTDEADAGSQEIAESDNGYFAIFDGHAGTFAADWCGKKLHIILEEVVRRHPNVPMPELLDQTFTTVDAQLEKLPVKNSGCTAAIAVLRWEDRVPSDRSATGSQPIAPAAAAAAAKKSEDSEKDKESGGSLDAPSSESAHARLKPSAIRQRVLYTANVGDARIILCRAGKALRLSYDHKGSDENEGRRIANAGGLILNNRVNGVLAVTRALGDAYMKDLVTGHPYTTETVIQPESDDFVIIACDGIWDVCSDQEAVDLVRDVEDPITASKMLVDHALGRFSTDNLSCMVVRFKKDALVDSQNNQDVGVESENGPSHITSEADKLVSDTKQKIAEGSNPAVGISPSNSGRGHDPIPIESDFVPTSLDGAVLEEEPSSISDSETDDKTDTKAGETTDAGKVGEAKDSKDAPQSEQGSQVK